MDMRVYMAAEYEERIEIQLRKTSCPPANVGFCRSFQMDRRQDCRTEKSILKRLEELEKPRRYSAEILPKFETRYSDKNENREIQHSPSYLYPASGSQTPTVLSPNNQHYGTYAVRDSNCVWQ
ncbi:hypothetical protein M7I_3040 [Glarea lozoyensis 74030]|uniref:Uncharacterized protein n=1 Tax=Glarea lozoyensis (strain ATCC 74030 / MF5533) TaxID=1104152 RepID=H0EKE2_GLAL7|nr:hypothetical protein M7I_3040 [Glarea lozoyensis 74030]